jgi:hypothetical protein
MRAIITQKTISEYSAVLCPLSSNIGIR